jgi:hypothetical protein
MFEHVGRDEPRRRGSRLHTGLLLLVAAVVCYAGFLSLQRVARWGREKREGVKVVYLPGEELPAGAQPGAVTAAPMPAPPPPPSEAAP